MHGELHFSLSPWDAECEYVDDMLECDFPRRVEADLPLSVTISHTYEAGTARSYPVPFSFNNGTEGTMIFFSVMPDDGKTPNYLQVQLHVHKPVQILCSMSVRWREPFEMSPLLCATQDRMRRVGFTLLQK